MTAPFVDPMFSQVYARELSAAEELLRDHWGHGYLAPALTASGEGPLPAGLPGAVSGETTVDANVRLHSPMAEGSQAAPPTEPGRLSLHAASEALRLLIEAQRMKEN